MKEEIPALLSKLYGHYILQTELPAEIEKKLVKKLITNDLLVEKKGFIMNRIVIIAAAILLISGAFLFGRFSNQQTEQQTINTAKNEYLLIVHHEADSEKDDQTIAKEYGAWMTTKFPHGEIIGGQELQMSGEFLVGTGEQFKTSSVDPITSMGGYFIIRADSYSDALAIAKTCPHLSYNGKLELRPFMYRD